MQPNGQYKKIVGTSYLGGAIEKRAIVHRDRVDEKIQIRAIAIKITTSERVLEVQKDSDFRGKQKSLASFVANEITINTGIGESTL